MKEFFIRELDQNNKTHDQLMQRIDKLEDKIDKNHQALIAAISDHNKEIAILKIKVAVIALISGLIPVSIKELLEKFLN